MNALATVSFACVAALIYSRHRTIKNAIIGLVTGTLAMTAVMLLWNWLILPFYMEGVTRADVIPMIIPLLLPFNLLKGALNMALALLLYKPVSAALHKAKLLPESGVKSVKSAVKNKFNFGVVIFSAILLCTCVMLLLAFMGII